MAGISIAPASARAMVQRPSRFFMDVSWRMTGCRANDGNTPVGQSYLQETRRYKANS
jgi:hypothetical protein